MTISANDRVFFPEHPEFGFGIVKLVDGGLLDDNPTCQVAFDWKPGLEPVPAGSLRLALNLVSGQSLPEEAWGGTEELQRRLGAALAISENSRTGAFNRSVTKPLPHQAYLLDKIVTHNHYGHVIADDVGMGKTIEAGLLIVTERQRNPLARILILSPAGVVLQWQDEMSDHFNLEFTIVGREWKPNNANLWRNNSLFLCSLDTLKQDRYRETLASLDPFDLIICDESHRLTARRDPLSGDLEITQNYSFVQWLTQEQQAVEWVFRGDGTPRSPRVLLLSATPHQGDEERFARLLHLARPDKIELEPEEHGHFFDTADLPECITRTAKKRAVDWEGKPIFKGHESKTLDIDLDDKEREVLDRLTRYVMEVMTFKDGGPGDALTRALALHTFQKIAASSWVALEAALNNRLTGRTEENDRVGGEGSMGEEFASAAVASEAQALEDLLKRIRALPTNSKWEQFTDLLVPGNGFRADGERILIFTQYRRTQEWLKERLEAQGERVAQIHGGLNLDERKAQREFFEGTGTIMISTEAGSEGANLHRKCHLEINYDIPWNPMRLLQRIGRLDRYGQKRKVRVVNLRAPSSWDSEIALRINQKLLTVQQDMGLVADEDYRTMILGDIHESISVAKVMSDSKWGSKPDKIDDAVNQALRETLKRQEELKRLFDDKLGMPENYDKSPAGLDADDFRHAFSWAAACQNVALRETRTSENKFLKGVYHFTLPDAYKVSFRASKSVYLVFDRDIYSEVKGEVLGTARGQSIRPSLGGFGDPVTDWFFKTSLQSKDAHPAFAIKRPDGMSSGVVWWVAYTARWKRSTQWAGPDAVFVAALNASGEVVDSVAASSVFKTLKEVRAGTSRIACLPPMGASSAWAIRRLKESIPADADQRYLHFSPFLFIQWTL